MNSSPFRDSRLKHQLEIEDAVEDEFDAAIMRTQRSDWLSVILRVVVLVVVFSLLARGIALYDISTADLLLPFVVESLTIIWVSRVLFEQINCPVFAKTSKPGSPIFWTPIIVGVMSYALNWDGLWSRLIETGVIWAIVSAALGLLISTLIEVRAWKHRGGVFVWTSAFGFSIRILAMFLLAFLFWPLVFSVLDGGPGWLPGEFRSLAWVTFAYLFFAELGALTISVLLHRSMRGPAQPNSGYAQ